MATSPNYAWAEPDNSSLVKNGAADIRTLGDAIDTSVWNVGYGQAGKNKIINGNFGVWQRGTTFTSIADGAYSADRYITAFNGTGVRSITQQTFTPATAPVAGYEGQYFVRIDQTTAGTGASANRFCQRIEDVRTFAGQTATFSFWAKAAASTTLPSLSAIQSFGSGGSGGVATSITTSIALTTSWQRFTYTVSIPSISGKTIGAGSYLEIRFELPLNVTSTVDFWGWQLEAGSVATAFQTATGTIQGELAACQRYYYRQTATQAFSNLGFGIANSATQVFLQIKTPVSLRSTSSAAIEYSTLAVYDTGAVTTVTALAITGSQISSNIVTVTATVSSGLTQYRPYFLIAENSTSAYIGYSAEL
jgi:hypothetical protein